MVVVVVAVENPRIIEDLQVHREHRVKSLFTKSNHVGISSLLLTITSLPLAITLLRLYCSANSTLKLLSDLFSTHPLNQGASRFRSTNHINTRLSYSSIRDLLLCHSLLLFLQSSCYCQAGELSTHRPLSTWYLHFRVQFTCSPLHQALQLIEAILCQSGSLEEVLPSKEGIQYRQQLVHLSIRASQAFLQPRVRSDQVRSNVLYLGPKMNHAPRSAPGKRHRQNSMS